jgi:hypothetical protein
MPSVRRFESSLKNPQQVLIFCTFWGAHVAPKPEGFSGALPHANVPSPAGETLPLPHNLMRNGIIVLSETNS